MDNHVFVKKLILDPSFRRWVKFAAPEDAIKWEAFIRDNPGRIESIEYAIAAVKALQFSTAGLQDQIVDSEVRKIVDAVRNTKQPIEKEELPNTKIRSANLWLKLTAAVVIGVLAIAVYWATKPAASHRYMYGGVDHFFEHEYVNGSDTAETIILSDRSKVLLYSKGKLAYNTFNNQDKREVRLSGQAYFIVTRDSLKPFIVYTDKLVTKVLGTSFIVNSFPENDSDASIEVKTGRVSVFKAADFKEDKKTQELVGLIITPNQKVVYAEKGKSLKKTLAGNPEVIDAPEHSGAFRFNATPLRNVFELLKQNYGIDILYNEDLISGCSLTASMEKETFYEKLDLICKIMNGSYEIVDGSVIFSFSGCK